MSLYQTFDTSKDLEKTGIFLQYGFAEGDLEKPIRILIARAGGSNTKFARVLEAKTKPHRRAIQTETLDAKLAESIFMDVYADTVILGWENVQGKDGTYLEFNRSNVIQVLIDLPDLYTDIREQAQKAALFRNVTLEIDAKN